MGNVIGSNTFNVLFILGLSALIAPLAVSSQLVRVDVPVMIGASLVSVALAADGEIGRLDGVVLGVLLVAYLATLLWLGRRDGERASTQEGRAANPTRPGFLLAAVQVAGGLTLLVVGSRLLVDSAVVFAQRLGVGELLIGLTIVAAGTSLPEVVTSVMAGLRGERDIAVGNVVGSNIFNLFAVLGVAGLASPGGVDVAPSVLGFDLPVMTAVAFACLPIFFTGMEIARWEGALLLAYYAAYTAYLILATTDHPALPDYAGAMLWFVMPITLLTLALLAAHALRGAKRL